MMIVPGWIALKTPAGPSRVPAGSPGYALETPLDRVPIHVHHAREGGGDTTPDGFDERAWIAGGPDE
jgi:hypothetical protein